MVNYEECIFCRLVRDEIPSMRVYEDSSTVALLDINPATIGHTLVITKKHYSNIHDTPEDDLGAVMKTIKIISDRLKNKMNALGVNILQNTGRHAGQIVDHIHFHVIPRYENDGIMIRFPRAQVTKEDMKSIQEKLKEDERKDYGTTEWI